MRSIMKNALIFILGMGYLYSIQVMFFSDLEKINAIFGLLSGIYFVGMSMVIFFTIVIFFLEAWDKGDDKETV